MSAISRREFLVATAAAGAGMVIGFYLPHQESGSRRRVFAPNAWLKISPQNEITIVMGRSEMGQGVWTSLPMLVAEELEADWSKIHVEQASADRSLYGSQVTGGSASVHEGWEPLRRAGASAREMLISAASARWGVLRSQCYAENGDVVHQPTARRLSYGDLATAAARLPIPSNVRLKEPKNYKLIGKKTQRLDTPAKVDGTTVFGLDFKPPEMLYAAVVRPPVWGAKLLNFDGDPARAVAGVRHVAQIGNAVAVVAENTWSAFQGRDAVDVNWNEGPNAQLSSENISQFFRQQLKKGGVTLRNEGNQNVGGRKLNAVYEVPYLAHAPMEPQNCTANFHDNRCEVWAPTQVPNEVKGDVAKALGLDPEQVTVNITFLGGGFGRRLETDYAVEAARVSKAVGAPVKVVWTREDDMRHSVYRPASYHELHATLNGQGWPIAWSHAIVAPSIIEQQEPGSIPNGRDPVVEDQASFIYAVPNIRTDYVMANTAVPAGFWRSVYASQIGYASECFLDELARAAGKDPYELRRKLLAQDREVKVGEDNWRTARLRGVLELAATKAGWGTPLPAGRFRGVACYPSFSSYAAQVAEVSLDQGTVRVHRVVCAVDCGQVVNPDGVEAQVQGSVMFGLSAALKSTLTVENGRIKERNFDSYEVLRMKEAPKVEVYIVPSSEAPTGIGEPAVPVVAPAVVNAVFAATRKPVRSLPVRISA